MTAFEGPHKEHVFKEFLSACGFNNSSHGDIILKKVEFLAQHMLTTSVINSSQQSLLRASVSHKTESAKLLHKLDQLKNTNRDLESLCGRFRSALESLQRVFDLPQLTDTVKTTDVEILSTAFTNPTPSPSLSTNPVAITMPEFCDPEALEKLRLDVHLLHARAHQLEERLIYFGRLDTDLGNAKIDAMNAEAELMKVQSEADLARGLSGWN